MVGMVNFVASDANLARLKEERMTLDELIQRFQEREIFVNVSADFGKGNDPEYKEFICRYTTEADWDHIHYLLPPKDVNCNAGRTLGARRNPALRSSPMPTEKTTSSPTSGTSKTMSIAIAATG
jgi:hypothetical protein